MWRTGTSRMTVTADGRRGVALPVVTMLVAVLAVLCLSGVSYLIGALDAGRNSEAEAHAAYVAQLGRADAFAYVVRNSDGPWTGRSLTTVLDDAGAAAGQYYYTIADLTMPDENQLCAVEVCAYWPSQADASAERRLRFWMEKDAGTWDTVVWTSVASSGAEPNTPEPGLTFIERRGSQDDDCKFWVRNDTGNGIYVTHVNGTWSSPAAYYEDVKFKVVEGEDYREVWRHIEHDGARMWSGGTAMFNEAGGALVPAGSTMEIEFKHFRENRTGDGGAEKDVHNSIFTVEVWALPDRYIFFTVPPEP